MVMVTYLPAQQSFDGFSLIPWFKTEKPRTTSVNIFFSEDKRNLKVTVDDAREDDVDEKELLRFLEKREIIKNTLEWKFEKKRDTEGLSTEEEFTTVEFAIFSGKIMKRKELFPYEEKKGEEFVTLLLPTEERIESEENPLAKAIMKELGGEEILPADI